MFFSLLCYNRRMTVSMSAKRKKERTNDIDRHRVSLRRKWYNEFTGRKVREKYGKADN